MERCQENCSNPGGSGRPAACRPRRGKRLIAPAARLKIRPARQSTKNKQSTKIKRPKSSAASGAAGGSAAGRLDLAVASRGLTRRVARAGPQTRRRPGAVRRGREASGAENALRRDVSKKWPAGAVGWRGSSAMLNLSHWERLGNIKLKWEACLAQCPRSGGIIENGATNLQNETKARIGDGKSQGELGRLVAIYVYF
jgi:hypothetical protein